MPDPTTSAPAPTTAPSTTPSAVTDPGGDLKALQDKLQMDAAATADLAKKMDVLKAQIADLSKSVGDINLQKTAYEKARPTLLAQDNQAQASHDTLKVELAAVIGDKKAAAVLQAQTDGQNAVKDKQTAVDTAATNLNNAVAEYAAAQADTPVKRQAYDRALSLVTRDQTWLKDLNDLATQIEKLRPGRQFSQMYFLVLEMEASLKKVELPEVNDYLATLNNATTALAAAVNKERDKKAAVDQATAALQQAQKDLTDATTNRRQKTLDSLKEPPPGGGV